VSRPVEALLKHAQIFCSQQSGLFAFCLSFHAEHAVDNFVSVHGLIKFATHLRYISCDFCSLLKVTWTRSCYSIYRMYIMFFTVVCWTFTVDINILVTFARTGETGNKGKGRENRCRTQDFRVRVYTCYEFILCELYYKK
jgi:hypothetical protein